MQRINKRIPASSQPPSNMIEPSVFMAITLDDVSRKLTNLMDIINDKFTNLSEINKNILQKNNEILNVSNNLLKTQFDILQATVTSTQESVADADEGKNITIYGTVNSTEFYTLDTQIDPGHPVKSMTFRNDCDKMIYVGVNVADSSIGPDVIDTIANNSRFTRVYKNEGFPLSYNRKVIKNIWALSSSGTAKFRLLLTW